MLQLLADSVVLPFVAGPLVMLGAIYASIYWRTRRRRTVAWTATRVALVGSWLSLLAWTIYLMHAINVSKRSTAMLGIVEIPLVGIPLAILAFVIAWAGTLLILSLRATDARPRPRTWSIRVASAIVVVALALAAAHANSVRLRNVAVTETSTDGLREVHHHWWTRHDAAVSRALAGNERTPPDVLAELARHHDWQVRYEVARNPSTPHPVLEELYSEDRNRFALAVNPRVPETMLQRLAEDPDHLVRYNLTGNPSVPRNLLDRLVTDPNEMVATAARRASRDRDDAESGPSAKKPVDRPME